MRLFANTRTILSLPWHPNGRSRFSETLAQSEYARAA